MTNTNLDEAQNLELARAGAAFRDAYIAAITKPNGKIAYGRAAALIMTGVIRSRKALPKWLQSFAAAFIVCTALDLVTYPRAVVAFLNDALTTTTGYTLGEVTDALWLLASTQLSNIPPVAVFAAGVAGIGAVLTPIVITRRVRARRPRPALSR